MFHMHFVSVRSRDKGLYGGFALAWADSSGEKTCGDGKDKFMIEFKKNFSKTLPYDRQQYWIYLGNNAEPSVKWYWFSFQLPGGNEASDGKVKDFKKFIDLYESLVKNIVLKFDNDTYWTVNQSRRNYYGWFPNKQNTLPLLRNLFKQNNVENEFKGALIMKKDDLFRFSRNLISYPVGMFNRPGKLYDDLDISHDKLPFIIKMSHHLDVNILSTDIELLKEVVNMVDLSLFILKTGHYTLI